MTNPEMDFAIRDQALSRLHLFVVIIIGRGMMIGPIFIIELLMLWERKLAIGLTKVYSLSILLSVSVLTYGAAFFRYQDIQQIAQKLGIFNLLVILYKRFKLKMALIELNLSQQSV